MGLKAKKTNKKKTKTFFLFFLERVVESKTPNILSETCWPLFKVTGDLFDIALDETCRRVETVELIVRQGSPSQDGPILFTELFDDNYNLQMDGSDLQKWPELTNYCNSYDIGLRLTGTY